MRYLFAPLLLWPLLGHAQSVQLPGQAEQLATVVMALPEADRAQPTVMGYDNAGRLVTLRTGTNALICLADDPSRPGFEVVAYHRDLEPFMARGRQLKAEGKGGGEIFKIREEEAKAGTLVMPQHPATLHILAGKEGHYDAAANQITGASYRYVVYIPFATAATTGLPERPLVPGGPWIMDPGTHRAHIMITPPAAE